MEIFDVVDAYGNPTGDRISRAEAHANGIRHRTAHIWLVRKWENGWQVLLQKRAANKDSFPGCYDTSSSGHIQAGDEPLESALRELREELGIRAQQQDLEFIGCFTVDYEKVFYGKLFRDKEVAFVYVCRMDVDADALTLQKEEVESAAWFDVEFVRRAITEPRDERFCIPAGGFRLAKAWCDAN